MARGSRNAVLLACLTHGAIGIAKLAGFLITGSSTLLAQALHCGADTGSQALLLLDETRAQRRPATEHPTGHGRERYFWAFVGAVVLFALGGAFALFEGIHQLQRSEPLQSFEVAFAVLIAAIAGEVWSFRVTLQVARPLRLGRSWAQFVRATKNAEVAMALLQALGALLGLGLAVIGLSLAHFTGDPRFDAAGSIAIGLLLGVTSAIVALKMHSVLVGKTAAESVLRDVEQALLAAPGVQHVVQLEMVHWGPQELLIAAKVEFDDTLSFAALTEHIDAAATSIREALSYSAKIFLEPELYDPTRRRTQRKDSGFFHRVKLD